MATQAQISDWITKTRQFYTKALDIFGQYQQLAFEARLTGRVSINELGEPITNLTVDNLKGENEGVNINALISAFIALGIAFETISDEDTALLFEAKL